MNRIQADLSTILGAGLMAGAIVEWLFGRIPLSDLGGAAAIAGVWIGIQQRHTPTTLNTTVSASTAVVNPPAIVSALGEHP